MAPTKFPVEELNDKAFYDLPPLPKSTKLGFKSTAGRFDQVSLTFLILQVRQSSPDLREGPVDPTKVASPSFTVKKDTAKRMITNIQTEPSPGPIYFQNEQSLTGVMFYGSRQDSVHLNQSKARPFGKSPRFDTTQIKERSRSPGPGQYAEQQPRTKNGALCKQIRFRKQEYETDSLGPGAYRHQDGFGTYMLGDVVWQMPASRNVAAIRGNLKSSLSLKTIASPSSSVALTRTKGTEAQ